MLEAAAGRGRMVVRRRRRRGRWRRRTVLIVVGGLVGRLLLMVLVGFLVLSDFLTIQRDRDGEAVAGSRWIGSLRGIACGAGDCINEMSTAAMEGEGRGGRARE